MTAQQVVSNWIDTKPELKNKIKIQGTFMLNSTLNVTYIKLQYNKGKKINNRHDPVGMAQGTPGKWWTTNGLSHRKRFYKTESWVLEVKYEQF